MGHAFIKIAMNGRAIYSLSGQLVKIFCQLGKIQQNIISKFYWIEFDS